MNITQIAADFVLMSHRKLMHMLWECPYVQKLWKTIWDLVSIFTAEYFDTEMCNIILCTYNKENQIYT